jgi:putative oxidoreductase
MDKAPHLNYYINHIKNKSMSPKTKNIISWILAVILALAYFGSGISKLLGAEIQIKNFESWGYPLWLRFPIGLIEIAFAIGLLIPAYRKKTIYGIFIWTVIAVITHLQAGQASMIGGPILFSLLAAPILFLSKEK